jgi:hypothetical protein
MTGRPWTEEEMEVLRSRYGTEPIKTIAASLNRTVGMVSGKAWLLGLCRSGKVESKPCAECGGFFEPPPRHPRQANCKKCVRRAATRKYRECHQDRVARSRREYLDTHRDERNRTVREYRRKTADKWKAWRKRQYERLKKTPEKFKATQDKTRRWRTKNPDKVDAARRRYREQHREELARRERARWQQKAAEKLGLELLALNTIITEKQDE